MADTVMTAEFGTIQNDPSLEEYSEACLCIFFFDRQSNWKLC